MAREYRDSGIEWIGQIPKEWELRRIQTSLYEINQKNSPIQTDFVLSLTNKDGVIPYEEKGDLGNKSKDNHDEYKLAYPNTIIANSMNILIGSVGISNYFGCVSPVYYVYKNYENADLRFFNYVFTTIPFQKKLRTHANGILEIRLRVSSDTILKQDIATPSLSEQQKIADYLDRVCGEVDEMVAIQETMIEELKAYKQSVITEAVTKGLNPRSASPLGSSKNVPMRNSGIDWIGEIPEHWDIAKLKFLCTYIKDGTHFSPETVNDGYPYITATDVRGVGLNYDMAKKVSKETFIELQKAGCQPRNGDVLLVKDGATTGRTGLMVDDTECVLLSSVAMLRPNSGVCQLYLMYLLMSDMMQSQIQLSMAGTALPRITLTKLTNFLGIIPPFEEQQQIASYLDTKCSEIDSLIALKQVKIEELKEYKKSVIYEYVTGKKEVV